MTTQTESPLLTGSVAARLPRVNLLPPELAERRALRRVQAGLLAAVVASAAVTGLLWEQAHHDVTGARANLATAAQRTTVLQGQVASLSGVTAAFGQVDAARAMLRTAYTDDIHWSAFLTNLSLYIPQGVWLTDATFTEQPPTQPAAGTTGTTGTSGTTGTTGTTGGASGVPGTPTSYGTVTFTGMAETRDEIATWLQTLATQRQFSAPYVTTINEESSTAGVLYSFSSTVQLTKRALTPAGQNALGS